MENNRMMDKPEQKENVAASSSKDNDNAASETLLQSLGLVVNNGKPRFKIGEPAFQGVPAASNFNLDSDDDDITSFVVLDKESLEDIEYSSRVSYEGIQKKSMSIDYNSVLSSLNTSEIQQKLSDLLQENVKLKETLKQNNDAMKRQFNTLASWQEEVMKIHQNHKQKFAETRDLIKHLKNENMELKLKLSMTDNTSKTNDEYKGKNAKDEECESLGSLGAYEAETVLASTETFVQTEEYKSLENTEINKEEETATATETYKEVPAAQTVTQNSAVQTPSVQTSSVQTSAVQTSAVQTSSVQTSAVQTSAIQTSSVQTSTVQTSSVETSTVQTSSVQTSFVQTVPSLQTSAAQTSPIQIPPMTYPEYAYAQAGPSHASYEQQYYQYQEEAAAYAESEYARRKDNTKRRTVSSTRYPLTDYLMQRLIQGCHVRVTGSMVAEAVEQPINLSTNYYNDAYGAPQEAEYDPAYADNYWCPEDMSVTIEPTTITYHPHPANGGEYCTATGCSLTDRQNEIDATIRKLKDDCEKKDEEIDYLKKLTRLFEERLVELPLKKEQKKTLNQIVIKEDTTQMNSAFSESREVFMETVKKYNSMMQRITDCFVSQSSRFCNIEKSIKESMDTLNMLKKLEVAKKHPETGEIQLISSKEIEAFKERLFTYEKELLDEEIAVIDDRQVFIKAINELQTLFTNYNNILCHVEIIHEENNKLSALNRSCMNNSKQAAQLREHNEMQQKLIVEEKLLLKKLRLDLEEEKKHVESQKKKVEEELKSVQKERQSLREERIALQSERASLDQQSKLCDNVLQSEKKMMNKRCEDMFNQMKIMEKRVTEDLIIIQKLQDDLTRKEQKVALLETQLTVYEEDFRQETKTKKAAIEEKGKLDEVFQQQLEINKRLRRQVEELQRIAGAKSGENNTPLETLPALPCPVCSEYFTSGLVEHVERCLDSQ